MKNLPDIPRTAILTLILRACYNPSLYMFRASRKRNPGINYLEEFK